MVNKPVISSWFLGFVALGGIPLDSHDSMNMFFFGGWKYVFNTFSEDYND